MDTVDVLTTDIKVSVLSSINKNLIFSFPLHEEIKELKAILQFAHNHIQMKKSTNHCSHP